VIRPGISVAKQAATLPLLTRRNATPKTTIDRLDSLANYRYETIAVIAGLLAQVLVKMVLETNITKAAVHHDRDHG
jgi:hypothetical protein